MGVFGEELKSKQRYEDYYCGSGKKRDRQDEFNRRFVQEFSHRGKDVLYYYQYGWHDQPEFTDDDKRDVLCYREYGNKRVGFSSEGDCVCYVVKCIERLVGKQAKSWLWPVACTKRSRIKSLSAPNAMDMK